MYTIFYIIDKKINFIFRASLGSTQIRRSNVEGGGERVVVQITTHYYATKCSILNNKEFVWRFYYVLLLGGVEFKMGFHHYSLYSN